MTPERIREILRKGATWGHYRKHMTIDEIAEVNAKWGTMPGTTFHDVLARILKGR